MNKIKSRNTVMFIISCIVTWTLLLMADLTVYLSGDNLIYAIGQKSAYNNAIFINNVYMGEGVVSPRYVIDALFSLMMRINGGNWGGAALVWIYFGAVVQSIGIANIAKRINEQYQVVLSAILTCLIIYCDNYLAGFDLIALESTSIGVALAFSFLSISFLIGEKRDYNLAWCFAACSIICHIHEGVYCCAIIFMFALIDCIFKKRLLISENRGILVAIAALILTVVPSFLTDSMDITEAEFVHIYSIYRHPHHLVPSSWDIDTIYKTIWVDVAFLLLGIQVSALTKKEDLKKKTAEAGILVFAWIAAISIMYVFTEIKPLALVSTFFFSKSFKYVLLVALIWLVNAFVDLRTQGQIISSYLILGFGLFATSFELKWIVLLLVAIVLFVCFEKEMVERKKSIIPENMYQLTDIIFFVLMICFKRESLGIGVDFFVRLLVSPKSTLASASKGITLTLVFFAIFAIAFAMKRKFKYYSVLCLIACICMLGLSLVQKVVVYSDGTLQLISGELALKKTMTEDLYELAEEFKAATDENAEFIGNPDDTAKTGWFQIVSERNCYVVNKVIPASKCMMDDWYARYLLTTGFADKSAEDIEAIMEFSDIDYVLVDAANYYKFDESENFGVFITSTANLYRIYKIVD